MHGSVPYYIKIRLRSHKNVGSGPIRLPEEELAPLCLKSDPMDIRVVPQLEGGAR